MFSHGYHYKPLAQQDQNWRTPFFDSHMNEKEEQGKKNSKAWGVSSSGSS